MPAQTPGRVGTPHNEMWCHRCLIARSRGFRFAMLVTAIAVAVQAANGQCGSPNTGSCCEITKDLPHCSNVGCCNTVCAFDAYCCQVEWDSFCVDYATSMCHPLCGSCGHAFEGDCCIANSNPGCNTASCCESVCEVIPSCCTVQWHQSCADLAGHLCSDLPGCEPTTCLIQGEGSCCSANDTPYCNDGHCCYTVCKLDPHCCEVEWDECCVNLAFNHCGDPNVLCQFPTCDGFCGGPSFGCRCDEACCSFLDCCWDKKHFCGGCWPVSSDPGPVVPPQLSCQHNCGGVAIGGCWCDESCCAFGDCCEHKTSFCFGCAAGFVPSYFGSCNFQCGGMSDGGCGCDDSCFAFGDCCWGVCHHCPSLSGCSPNPADVTGNGVANIFDLLFILANWGECQFERCFIMEKCEGDFNHDGVVNVFDLLFVLENWG